MHFFDLGIPSPPVIDYEIERVNRAHRNKVILRIGIIFTIVFIALTVTMICLYFNARKSQLVVSSVVSATMTTSIATILQDEGHVCLHPKTVMPPVDIFYSFDCSNVTDEITGTYNGFGAALLRTDLNNETLQTMLPTYVTPDYSGQGAALKLNSAVSYQYIELVRSPIFFNRTFTISFWLNPNVQASVDYCLLSQLYQSASALTINIIDQRISLRIYDSLLWSSTRLKNFQWQYVTLIFVQDDLSKAIFIDGILDSVGITNQPQYGNFEIERTTIGSYDVFNQYNGLMDDLSIVYRIKNRIDTLNEATLVVHYTFDGDGEENDSLFDDVGSNSIRANGMYVTRIIGSRRVGHSSLYLNDSTLSYFQSSGFVLLVNHNYTYSYALWLHVSNASLIMPLVHIVARDETASMKSSGSLCLALLVASKANAYDSSMQLSLYIYGPDGQHVITSTMRISQSIWYHVAVISETHSFNLYINGTLVASSSGLNMTTFEINNQQRLTLTIGNPTRKSIDNSLDLSMCSFDETQIQSNRSAIGVEDLRFYSRQIKPREVQALINDEPMPTMYYFN